MQTYTHAAIGAALGAAFFPGDYVAEAALVTASVAPDLVMVPAFLVDKLAGRKPLEYQTEELMVLKEMSHSVVLWSGFLALVWLFGLIAPLYAFALGGLAHVVVDVFTHGSGPKENRPFWETDLAFMWPLPLDLRPLGLWEYRKDAGDLTPKAFELFVLIASLFLATLLWLR